MIDYAVTDFLLQAVLKLLTDYYAFILSSQLYQNLQLKQYSEYYFKRNNFLCPYTHLRWLANRFIHFKLRHLDVPSYTFDRYFKFGMIWKNRTTDILITFEMSLIKNQIAIFYFLWKWNENSRYLMIFIYCFR